MLKEDDVELVLANMRADFIIDCKEKLDAVQDNISLIGRDGSNYNDHLMMIKREAHSLKGLGGTFGFPSITHICHALEDYLEMTEGRLDVTPDILNQFFDPISRILDGQQNPDENQTREILAGLPDQLQTDSGQVIEGKGNAVLAMPKDLWRTIAGQEITSLGYKVAMVDTVVGAIDRGLTLKPELIVVGMQLDRAKGIELAAAFREFKNTADAKIIILSASIGRSTHSENTAMILKGPNFSSDLRQFLNTP